MIQTSLPLTQIPKTQTDHINWIRLIRSRRVGPATFHRLMREHGSAIAALDALPALAQQAGVQKYQVCLVDTAEAELLEAQHKGYYPLCFGSENYPDLLQDTHDALPLLWAKRNIKCLSKPTLNAYQSQPSHWLVPAMPLAWGGG